MTYEQLAKVNAEIKTTDIKGKEYAEVPQRINAFRKLYPEGFIRTHIVDLHEGFVAIRAEVGFYDAQANYEYILATGTAYEREKGMINSTSFIENCETSAIGRALGIAGFGIGASVASAEEVANAIAQQEAERKPKEKPAVKQEKPQDVPDDMKPSDTIDDTKVAVLVKKLNEAKIPTEKVLKLYKVSSLAELTPKAWKNAIDHIEDIKKVSV